MDTLSDILLLRNQSIISSAQSKGVITTNVVSRILPDAIDITNGFNYQYQKVVERYYSDIEKTSQRVKAYLDTHPDASNRYYRTRAVDKAWEMERVDVEWGGRGSRNWNKSERSEILRRGRISQEKLDGKIVKEYPGHHQQSVAFHPEEQGNPDNIKFFRSREEHVEKGHFGDTHNESNAPMINRGEMLRKTNRRRVIKNELYSAGLTALISFATSASLNFIIEIANSGLDPESVKRALKNAGRNGAEGAVITMICYGISRAILPSATKTISELLSKWNINLSREIVSGGIIAAVTISVTSVYLYIQLRRAGFNIRESLVSVGKNAFFSLAISSIIIYVGAKCGNIYELIFSLAVVAAQIFYSIYKNKQEQALLEKINICLIEYSYADAQSKLFEYSPNTCIAVN